MSQVWVILGVMLVCSITWATIAICSQLARIARTLEQLYTGGE